jgi:hypothetical protein
MPIIGEGEEEGNNRYRSKPFVPAVHEVWCIGNNLCKIGVSNLKICRVMCKKENVSTGFWGKGHWYQTHCRVGLLWTTWQLLASSKAFFLFSSTEPCWQSEVPQFFYWSNMAYSYLPTLLGVFAGTLNSWWQVHRLQLMKLSGGG